MKAKLEQESWRKRQPAETGRARERDPDRSPGDSRGAEYRVGLIFLG